MNKKEIGELGEKIGARQLMSKGYKILTRNFKGRLFELDIICRDLNGVLVFCEVKTMVRFAGSAPSLKPEDNLSWEKLKKIKRGCGVFLARYPSLLIEECGWRIDLLAVALTNSGGKLSAEVRHFKNIY